MNKIVFLLLFTSVFCFGQNSKRDDIREKYLVNGAYKYHYLMPEWTENIDKALKIDSTIAELWQMKALPLWKTRKYDLALQSFDKAVKYNRQAFLSRRGYLKCIFKKDYRAAIEDLEQAEKEFGEVNQNDHSLKFYVALSHLQLNEFDIAEKTMKNDMQNTLKISGESGIHYLQQFYLGVILYEEKKYDEAILNFDKALSFYKNFADAEYYKGLCLLKISKNQEGVNLLYKAKEDAENHHSFHEDDSYYELFPYQVNWGMAKWTIPNYKEN